MNKQFFAWDPARHFLRFDEAPYDDSGNELTLWNGANLDPETTIHLVKPRKGRLADFLYSPLLLLFVSGRALDVLRQARIPSCRVHPLNLRDAEGLLINDGYSWVNVALVVPVMDEHRSKFTRRDVGGRGIDRVDRLVLDDSRVPNEDIFLIKEISLIVFSEPLVRAIREAGLTGAKFEPLDENFRWPA
jgi:hypothetical protein